MRKWIEIIRPYPSFQKNKPYRVRVADIKKNTDTGTLEVSLQFQDKYQAGRKIQIPLNLPIRPDGHTADFFRACGITVETNSKISPPDVIGCEINIVFGQVDVDNNWQSIHFEPVSQVKEGGKNESLQL